MLNHHIHKNSDVSPWVILIHGLFGNLDNLTVIRRALESDYNVLSIDLPSHGKSPSFNTFSFTNCANELHRLLAHLGIEQAHFLGHSLGGKVAMTYALTYPKCVNKLILADIAPVAYTPRHQNVFNGLLGTDLESINSRKEADTKLAEHINESGVRQFLLKSLYQESEQWHWRFDLTLIHKEYPQISEAITSDNVFSGDVLFIKGALSDYILPEHQAAIVALFPNSKAKIIANTGHWLHAEKPVAFNRIVSQFLAD